MQEKETEYEHKYAFVEIQPQIQRRWEAVEYTYITTECSDLQIL